MVSLFFLVFLQLDRFPVELAVPDFLAQRIVSATFVPAFLQRQDRGDAVDDVVRFFHAFFRQRGVLVLFGFGHIFHRADYLADLSDAALDQFILRGDFLKGAQQHPDDFRDISE